MSNDKKKNKKTRVATKNLRTAALGFAMTPPVGEMIEAGCGK